MIPIKRSTNPRMHTNPPVYGFYNQRGATLIFMTIMTLVGVLVVSLAVANVSTRNIRNSTEQLYSTRALFASETGLERSLYEVRVNSIDVSSSTCSVAQDSLDFTTLPPACAASTSASTINTLSLSPDYKTYYRVFASSTVSGTETISLLRSQGWFNNITRQVEVSF